MIGRRQFGYLVVELLVVNGLLFGFSLPQGAARMVGINFGPLCLCFYLER